MWTTLHMGLHNATPDMQTVTVQLASCLVEADTRGMPSSPMRRRLIGRKLRDLRTEAGVAVAQAATRLECSQSKISRIETGEVSVRAAELQALLALYGADFALGEEIMAWWREAQHATWWSAYKPFWPAYVDLESMATELRAYCAGTLPGMLQTRAYAYGAIKTHTPEIHEDELGQQIDLRLRRRDRLHGRDPRLSAWYIVEEHALRRPYCHPVEMADAVGELLKAVDQHPNLTLQVLPTGAYCPPTGRGSFSMISVDGLSVACTEAGLSDMLCDDRRQIAEAELRWGRLVADALSPVESLKVVDSVREMWANRND